LILSAATGGGVRDALRALLKVIDGARESAGVKPQEAAAWQP
jgi:hypothetical protein